MNTSMAGQWQGEIEGQVSGEIRLDIDELSDRYRGSAYINLRTEPVIFVLLRLYSSDKAVKQRFDCEVSLVNANLIPLSDDERSECYPTITVPSRANVDFELSGDSLSVSWILHSQSKATAVLCRAQSHLASQITPNRDITNWSKFVDYVMNIEPRQYIFRGQEKTWRLRTAFHRTNRKDLLTLQRADIPRIYQSIIAYTNKYLDLNYPEQNAALWYLLQHHGYPTPLLDWSYSPFVAMFFAARMALSGQNTTCSVRIFAFNKAQWVADFAQLGCMAHIEKHFSILEPLAIDNNRAAPQQSLVTVTNVDDIESFIRIIEGKHNRRYLEAFDVDISDPRKILWDLSLMGVSAASLLPGLDGICEQLRFENFEMIR